MKAMQMRVNSEAQRNTGGFRKYLVHLVGAAVATAVWLGASPAFAQSCPVGEGVDVEPAGDTIAGDLVPGTNAAFTAGTITVNCNTSHTSGDLPTIGNPGDPVSGVLAPATFTSCTSSIGFAATTTTNATNGNWGLGISCGGQATLHIPRAGAVTRVATCTITVAPNAAIDIPATFTPGAPGTPGTLTVDTTVPISRSGFLCPNATTAAFRATYNITDLTNPAADITVTQVPH
jgi:hypothetical protein